MGRKTSLILLLAALLLQGGCSMVETYRSLKEADKLIDAAEDEANRENYNEAIQKYLEARALLDLPGDYPVDRVLTGDKKKDIEESLEQLRTRAEEQGLIRVDDQYLDGDELGDALSGVMAKVIKNSGSIAFDREIVVTESLSVSSSDTSSGDHDLVIDLILKDVGSDSQFRQESWNAIRFLLLGAFGHGFSYHGLPRFPIRPWMGVITEWGTSEKRIAENHEVGLKNKIGSLTINLYKGRHRQGRGAVFDLYGHETLEAAGPYWDKELVRSYTVEREDAERINWDEFDRVPDSVLYGLLKKK